MRDQFAGDISDLLKFSLLRELAGNDKRLGIGWYFVPDHNGRQDGRHREFCSELSWKNLDEEVRMALVDLPDRSVKALEELPFWPKDTKFHPEPILVGRQRQSWFEGMKKQLAGCDLIFLDPDNGLGQAGKLHATETEILNLKEKQRALLLIKFPGRQEHAQQVNKYHDRLAVDAQIDSVMTLRICVMLRVKTKQGNWQKIPRIRWFSLIDGNKPLQNRARTFAVRLQEIANVNVHVDFWERGRD